MHVYQITHRTTGANIGTWPADSPEAAYLASCADAGYPDPEGPTARDEDGVQLCPRIADLMITPLDTDDRSAIRLAADLIEKALPYRSSLLCPACGSLPLADGPNSDAAEPGIVCLCETCNEWTDIARWEAAAKAEPLDPARAALALLRGRLTTPAGGR